MEIPAPAGLPGNIGRFCGAPSAHPYVRGVINWELILLGEMDDPSPRPRGY